MGSIRADSSVIIWKLRFYFPIFEDTTKLYVDGGPEFSPRATKTGGSLQHFLSRAYFFECNGRAKVAFETAKSLLMENLSTLAELNTDNFLRSRLQMSNTADADCCLFPA